MPKKELYFIFQTLDCGGAEKSILELIKLLSNKEKYQINLLYFKKVNDLSDEIPISVKKLHLKSPSWIELFNKLYIDQLSSRKKRIYITALDVPILILLITKILTFKKSKVVILTRCALKGSLKGSNFIKKLIIKSTRRFIYPFANYCISNSRYAYEELIKRKLINKGNLSYIPNIVDIEKYETLSKKNINFPNKYSPFILCLGNVNERKNYPLAIESFSKISDKHQSLNLLIVGAIQSKKEFSVLKKLIKKYSLNSRVFFLGYQKNPLPIIKKCEFLLHTSFSEGFPNAVLQAISLQKSVLNTTCCGDGKYICSEYSWCRNFITNSSTILSENINMFISSKKEIKRDLNKLNQYKIKKVLESYEQVLNYF